MGDRDVDSERVAAIARGRAAWPELPQIEAAAFAAYLADRLPADADLAAAPIADLYLACACVSGEPAAIRAFDDRYLREVGFAAARLRAPAAVADEARQVVRELVFVGRGGAPAIASYAGRGDLRGWVRVIAMREVLRLCERGAREVAIGDEQLLDALSPAGDPELEQIKLRYRDVFAAAFRDAVRALEPRERTLLRHSVIDGLGVEAIGRLYRVHHATAARWLARAREALLEATRARLAAELRLSDAEVDSVLRLIRSRMDVSIESLLTP